jgi:sphingolipid 4-desaturase/C4-monooxygenase
MIRSDFTYTDTLNPHAQRAREIIKKYPQVKEWMGPYLLSPVYITLILTLQMAIAISFAEYNISWGWILLTSWVIGAIANHSMFVFVHEASHDLVAKGRRANKIWGIISNIPQGVPSAVSFRTYHLIHHANMGEYDYDADLAYHQEAKIVGNSWWKKSLWFVGFLAVEAVRPLRLKKGKMIDGWVIFNTVFIIALDVYIYMAFGPKALGYILLSTLFSVGLHPVGARWIQEHYIYKEGQETYSYYGPLNKLNFNIGYHVEHHDLHTIPWPYMPKLRALANEYYDDLYAHQSWTKLLLDFIFNPEKDLFCRILRRPNKAKKKTPVAEKVEAEYLPPSTEDEELQILSQKKSLEEGLGSLSK